MQQVLLRTLLGHIQHQVITHQTTKSDTWLKSICNSEISTSLAKSNMMRSSLLQIIPESTDYGGYQAAWQKKKKQNVFRN